MLGALEHSVTNTAANKRPRIRVPQTTQSTHDDVDGDTRVYAIIASFIILTKLPVSEFKTLLDVVNYWIDQLRGVYDQYAANISKGAYKIWEDENKDKMRTEGFYDSREFRHHPSVRDEAYLDLYTSGKFMGIIKRALRILAEDPTRRSMWGIYKNFSSIPRREFFIMSSIDTDVLWMLLTPAFRRPCRSRDDNRLPAPIDLSLMK